METTFNPHDFAVTFITVTIIGSGFGIWLAIYFNPDKKEKIIKGLKILAGYILGPLIGSILYHLLSTKSLKEFALFGIATIIICVAVSMYIVTRNQQVNAKYQENKITIISLVISQSIPFGILYILSSVVIEGLKIPFT